jgi:hypothetical protein
MAMRNAVTGDLRAFVEQCFAGPVRVYVDT